MGTIATLFSGWIGLFIAAVGMIAFGLGLPSAIMLYFGAGIATFILMIGINLQPQRDTG